jgi:hypothetical protein
MAEQALDHVEREMRVAWAAVKRHRGLYAIAGRQWDRDSAARAKEDLFALIEIRKILTGRGRPRY